MDALNSSRPPKSLQAESEQGTLRSSLAGPAWVLSRVVRHSCAS